jgi:hypothetical protein
MIGTFEAAHCVVPFLNFRWDDRNVLMRYDCHEDRPSPIGMQAYELLNSSSETFGTDLFLNTKY